MSTRKITDNQFSDKTTIDSNRLDDAIDNVTERINNVQKGDIKQRFIESQLVSGWMVCRGNSTLGENGYQWGYHGTGTGQNPFPWLRTANTTNDEVNAKGCTNEYRVKGIFNPYFSNHESPFSGDAREEAWTGTNTRGSTQYVWTQSHQQEGDKSAILNAINFQMIYDGRYTANGGYTAGTPVYGDEYQYGALDAVAQRWLGLDFAYEGWPLKDMHVVVDVDFPLDPEERKLNSKIVGRHMWRIDSDMISFYQIPTDDMLLSRTMWPEVSNSGLVPHLAALSSVSINLKDLAIPLPPGARLRWRLVIPRYGNPNNPDLAPETIMVEPWCLDPMARYSWGSTLSLLEEIRG